MTLRTSHLDLDVRLDKEFNPTYSRLVIEALIAKAGGDLKAVQKFHRSEDESKAYRRLLFSPRTDYEGKEIEPLEPEYMSRRCLLIPASLVTDFIGEWESKTPDVEVDSVTSQLHQLHPVTSKM